MTFEHATYTDHQPLPQDRYQDDLQQAVKLEDTIDLIERNLQSPYFYEDDRQQVEENLEFFKQRHQEVIMSLSTHTIAMAGVEVAA